MNNRVSIGLTTTTSMGIHPSGPFHLLDLDQMDILIVVGTKKENGCLNNIGVDGMEKEDIIIYSKE